MLHSMQTDILFQYDKTQQVMKRFSELNEKTVELPGTVTSQQ